MAGQVLVARRIIGALLMLGALPVASSGWLFCELVLGSMCGNPTAWLPVTVPLGLASFGGGVALVVSSRRWPTA